MTKGYNWEKNPVLINMHSDITKLATKIRNEANANGIAHSAFPSSSIADRCPKELERLVFKYIASTQLPKSKLNELIEFVKHEQNSIIDMARNKDASYGNENQLESIISNRCQSIICVLLETYDSRHNQLIINRISLTLGAIGTIGTIISFIVAIMDLFC